MFNMMRVHRYTVIRENIVLYDKRVHRFALIREYIGLL